MFLKKLKTSLRQSLGPKLQYFAYVSGAMRLSARFTNSNNSAIALMYHSVAENNSAQWIDPRNHVMAYIFEKQMEFLSENKKVISLDDLVNAVLRGRPLDEESVVLTFDDGYLDNLHIAAPILDRLNLTATLFLPTNYIDRGETQWVDQVYTIFKHRSKLTLNLPGSRTIFHLDHPEHENSAYKAVCTELIKADAVKRRSLLIDLQDQLQPEFTAPRLTMNWEEVRTLLSKHHCFQLGGHTQEHTDLTAASPKNAKKEIDFCAQRIKDETGITPRYFSFCYGRSNQNLRNMLAHTWIKAAFGDCNNSPAINDSTNIFNMSRVEAPSSIKNFDLITNSFNNGFWRKIGR